MPLATHSPPPQAEVAPGYTSKASWCATSQDFQAQLCGLVLTPSKPTSLPRDLLVHHCGPLDTSTDCDYPPRPCLHHQAPHQHRPSTTPQGIEAVRGDPPGSLQADETLPRSRARARPRRADDQTPAARRPHRPRTHRRHRATHARIPGRSSESDGRPRSFAPRPPFASLTFLRSRIPAYPLGGCSRPIHIDRDFFL